MLYTIPQLYQQLIRKPLEVYEVFKNFFGENYVDLQYSKSEEEVCNYIDGYLTQSAVSPSDNGEYEVSDSLFRSLLIDVSDDFFKCFIYVWWPSVTVTNEFDKSIDIQDLYAKIPLSLEGRIPYESAGFLLNRATYTKEQFYSGYLHSHIQNIPKDNFTRFMSPCLGHGPIIKTIATLRNECNDVSWMLFCQELSMYVTVESIAGGPWKRLESVGSLYRSLTHTGFDYSISRSDNPVPLPDSVIHSFTKYYLEHGHLSLDFINGKYVCGMPYFDFIIDISNAFISFYNELPANNVPCSISSLFAHNILYRLLTHNGLFYQQYAYYTESGLNRYQGKRVLTFKGREILTRIIDSDSDNSSEVTVLNHALSVNILLFILQIINYQYKNVRNDNLYNPSKPFDSFSSPDSTSQTRQRVCFL